MTTASPILWTNEKMMIALCPYCDAPEYRNYSKADEAIMSHCREGFYLARGSFDFTMAKKTMAARLEHNRQRKAAKDAARAAMVQIPPAE